MAKGREDSPVGEKGKGSSMPVSEGEDLVRRDPFGNQSGDRAKGPVMKEGVLESKGLVRELRRVVRVKGEGGPLPVSGWEGHQMLRQETGEKGERIPPWGPVGETMGPVINYPYSSSTDRAGGRGSKKSILCSLDDFHVLMNSSGDRCIMKTPNTERN